MIRPSRPTGQPLIADNSLNEVLESSGTFEARSNSIITAIAVISWYYCCTDVKILNLRLAI
jgi:hypothetical protein